MIALYHIFSGHWGTFLNFFKKSLNFFLNIFMGILYSSFREHAVHVLGHLCISASVNEMQTEHRPQLRLFYALYVFLRLAGQLQKLLFLPLHDIFISFAEFFFLHISWFRYACDLNRSYGSVPPGPFYNIPHYRRVFQKLLQALDSSL